MINNALTIKQTRKFIDDGISAMFILFQNFHYDEINKCLKKYNKNIDTIDLDDFVFGILQYLTSDLLDIKKKELSKSIQN